MLAQEFEHRITNGLQLIASLLLLQSRAMTTPEASIQLSIAARRIDALGSVHHRENKKQETITEFVYPQSRCRSSR